MDWYHYALIVGAGMVAGYINTLAGSGSLLTLPLLIFIGLPPGVANGTNRVAIFFQSLVGAAGLKKQARLKWETAVGLGIPSIAGSVAGALLALAIPGKSMERAIGLLLILMFFLVLFKPDVWLRERPASKYMSHLWVRTAVFFLIGAYGGFVQAGVGFFLLGGLVLGAGLDLVRANAVKNFLVFLYTPFALVVYIMAGQVDYKAGLILSAGSVTGAWLGTRTALSWGPVFVRYVLLVAVLASAIQLLFF